MATCSEIIAKDGWEFAQESERPWASEQATSDAGVTILNLYSRYKPTLEMLSEEGGPTLPIYGQFVEYMEDAFDMQCDPF